MEMTGLDSDVLEQLYKLCSTRLCSNTLGQVHRRIGREGDGEGRGEEEGGSYISAWWGRVSYKPLCMAILAAARPVHSLPPVFVQYVFEQQSTTSHILLLCSLHKTCMLYQNNSCHRCRVVSMLWYMEPV